MAAMIRFQNGSKGEQRMISHIAIEAARWERERKIQEAIRRRRLLVGEGPDPELAGVAVAARLRRRERLAQPARLATP
jgi:hypothetical protein